ncbi:hypothetical protein G5I_09941 [Acromyrmex echinatior]|uniref:Uncharacterized protein n=1 Tax=Acromyrmex echinatior TaxID=103372 RepID=F4WVK1_ACREC|nr:hypothetical protein G5I_09941 [Acromyrmex echinatior]
MERRMKGDVGGKGGGGGTEGEEEGAWCVGEEEGEERAKRNERRTDAPFPSAVAVSRNIPCGHDGTDKDILVYEVRNASNRRDVRKLAGNWYLSFFLFTVTSKPYVGPKPQKGCTVLAPLNVLPVSAKKKRNIVHASLGCSLIR